MFFFLSSPPSILYGSVSIHLLEYSLFWAFLLAPTVKNLPAMQETWVQHGTTDWFQIRKGVRQVYILSPCFFNLYAE